MTRKTSSDTTVYDPTCGSGSLLLKVADEAGDKRHALRAGKGRCYQPPCPDEHDPARLSHRAIVQGNSLADPKFTETAALKTFDYVVANPPFSDKRWSTGLDPLNDPFDRFKYFGVPPAKQGDYAYLLHIVRSLKSTGKGACILPHGVLFRGNAEADIRRALIRKGYIKGIVGLPANIFYGTGIPACIVAIDKQDAHARKGIFMIDASGGFMKDGPKNRLRAQDIHQIVDVFNRLLEIPKYSRMVPVEEIEKNDFNLNLPRYIDSQQAEDIQDIDGHLRGGIPVRDVDALCRYWKVCPNLRQTLFKANRPGYVDLAVDKAGIKPAIYGHPEFAKAGTCEYNGLCSSITAIGRRHEQSAFVNIVGFGVRCRTYRWCVRNDSSYGLLFRCQEVISRRLHEDATAVHHLGGIVLPIAFDLASSRTVLPSPYCCKS